MVKTRLIVLTSVCSVVFPVYGQQVSPPKIDRVIVSPPPNSAGWNNTAVTVAFECGRDVRDCPKPIVVNTEGAMQQPARLNIDRTGPRVQIVSTTLLSTGSLRVSAIVTDELSGVRATACNGQPTNITTGLVTCDIPMQDGVNDIAVTAIDVADNAASAASQIIRRATSNDSEIMPVEMLVKVGQGRVVQFLDSAGHEIDGADWTIENPSVATVDPRTRVVSGLAPGDTLVTASRLSHTTQARVIVVAPNAVLPSGTALWRMRSQGIPTGLTATPERQVDGPDMVFVGTQPDGFVLLRAATVAGRLLSKEYAALSPGERVVDWMGDHDGGVLLWAESGSRSTIVRTGRPRRGELWRYECASPASRYWAMSWPGTLFVAEKAETGFGHVTGIDSRTGNVRFRVPIPHTLGSHEGFGAITIPTGAEAMMLFATSAARVDLLRILDDGSARVSPVIDSIESNPPIIGLGGVYPDGHDAVVALIQRQYAGGRSDGLVVRIDGDKRSSYVLPAVGEYVLGENDEALTTDHNILVSFDILTGKIRWTFEAPPDGNIQLEFAAGGGGAVVRITGGSQPGRYRFDGVGNRTLVLPG
jgi:outer membrane protein assembly factor BamB